MPARLFSAQRARRDTGWQGRQPNASHRSVTIGNIVQTFTILHISLCF
jgi:hypothetical protein